MKCLVLILLLIAPLTAWSCPDIYWPVSIKAKHEGNILDNFIHRQGWQPKNPTCQSWANLTDANQSPLYEHSLETVE